jgi:hypothetical protein
MAVMDRAGPDLRPAIEDFGYVLGSDGKKRWTVSVYTTAAALLASRLDVTSWQQVAKSHIREHMAWLSKTRYVTDAASPGGLPPVVWAGGRTRLG